MVPWRTPWAYGDGIHWDVFSTPPALFLPATLRHSPYSSIIASPVTPPGWVFVVIGVSMMGFVGSPRAQTE